ncbi:hypothetical protein HK102_011445 [Quaeritorhiza haematococci]|nr:hypothetical protein HK102_011445 [Quaeritorhiza haematococci]
MQQQSAILVALLAFLAAFLGAHAVPVSADDNDNARLPPVPIVYFKVGKERGQTQYATEIFNGPVQVNHKFAIMYDAARAKCEHYFENGVDSWTAHVGFTTTTGQTFAQYAAVAYIDSITNNTITPTVSIPPMAKPGKAYFWFDCTNAIGQIEYDSNMGSNWEVEIYEEKETH